MVIEAKDLPINCSARGKDPVPSDRAAHIVIKRECESGGFNESVSLVGKYVNLPA
jgi:hypothetical protein